MYKVFYDYYGNCYEYAVPEGSKLEKMLDEIYPPEPYYEGGIEEPENYIEQGTYFRNKELDIEIRNTVYAHLKKQNFYHGGKQSHMVVCKDEEKGFYDVYSFYTQNEFIEIINTIRNSSHYRQ